MFVQSSSASISISGKIALSRAWHDKQVYIEENKLFYITKGELVLRVNGKEVLCRAGEIVLVPARTCHDYYLSPLEECHKYWLHFKMGSDGCEALEGMTAPLHMTVPQEEREKVEERFSFLLEEEKEAFDPYKKIGVLYELVIYFLEKTKAVLAVKPKGEFDELARYINEHLKEDLSLEVLAKRVCLSPGYFARRFKAAMGVSPSKYVSMVRLEKAKAALAESERSIQKILHEVGFSDTTYFSKNFKRYTGYSPGAFRRLSRLHR